MKINQVEELVGITKKNIRFYEEKGLITPARNPENGYREYSLEHVNELMKIKLLRKMSVPIDEIRRIQNKELTLGNCMKRHVIVLKQEEENLAKIKAMAEEMSKSDGTFSDLDSKSYLEKMELLEKGGTRFMDIERADKKKKKVAPVVAGVVVMALMALTIAVIIWIQSVEAMPIGLCIAFIASPIVVIVGIILALKDRMSEIEGGELDEARKY